MRLLHPLPIPGSGSGSNSNQVLQSVGGANPPNTHFTNAFSSSVGGVTGYEGAGGSVAALAGNPGSRIVHMKGGSNLMRRTGGGSSKRSKGSKGSKGNKGSNTCTCKKSCTCRSRRCTCNKSCKCSKSCKCRSRSRSRSRSRRTMRGGSGGLSATAASFNGGANLPYQQYTGGQPNSPSFSVGSTAPLPNSAMANPPPITVRTGCGGK